MLNLILVFSIIWSSSACLTHASNYALKMLSSILLEMISTTLPIALNGMLPAHMARLSQVHFQEGSHCQAHEDICFHIWSCTVESKRCLSADSRHLERYGGKHVLVHGWWAARGMLYSRNRAAFGGGNADVRKYHISNNIMSAVTKTETHNFTFSWCYPLYA